MYKVLLVDDEKKVLTSLERGVDWNKSGCYVAGKASNGTQAVQLVEELRPHIIFTDIRMPGLSGLDLIERIKNIDSNIQFVVISGYAEFSYAQRSLDLDVLGYCLKPFDDEEIDRLLRKASERLVKIKEKEEIYETRNASLREILKYVEEHYQHDITIQSIAKKFFLNPNYLSQLFKKELNITFTDYMTNTRINAAKRLLYTTNLSIGEIADRIGYRDYFYFIRIFKKMTSQTPGQYRKGIEASATS